MRVEVADLSDDLAESRRISVSLRRIRSGPRWSDQTFVACESSSHSSVPSNASPNSAASRPAGPSNRSALRPLDETGHADWIRPRAEGDGASRTSRRLEPQGGQLRGHPARGAGAMRDLVLLGRRPQAKGVPAAGRLRRGLEDRVATRSSSPRRSCPAAGPSAGGPRPSRPSYSATALPRPAAWPRSWPPWGSSGDVRDAPSPSALGDDRRARFRRAASCDLLDGPAGRDAADRPGIPRHTRMAARLAGLRSVTPTGTQ